MVGSASTVAYLHDWASGTYSDMPGFACLLKDLLVLSKLEVCFWLPSYKHGMSNTCNPPSTTSKWSKMLQMVASKTVDHTSSRQPSSNSAKYVSGVCHNTVPPPTSSIGGFDAMT